MLNLTDVALRRGSELLFEEVNLSVYRGQKFGITGANGCGKSSLLALILGELAVDQGDFSLATGLSIASVEQETQLSDRVALEYVIDGDRELRAVEDRLLRLVPKAYLLHAHHWLILHGRYVCQARKPRCGACTIADLCEYRHKTEIGTEE